MREVESYLRRAEEALQLLIHAEGDDAKRAIVEIVRTWIRIAEARATRHGIATPELAATVRTLNDSLDRTHRVDP